jgi:transposase
MVKLSYKDKVNLYNDKMKGISYSKICDKYGIYMGYAKFLVRLINKHGITILKNGKRKKYTEAEKQEAIIRIVYNNESSCSVAIDMGMATTTTLRNWVKKYKENGYNIVERKRGRPTMPKKPKQKETQEETIKRLEEENLYLKAELEYSKKLRAVVQARKNQQQKKK